MLLRAYPRSAVVDSHINQEQEKDWPKAFNKLDPFTQVEFQGLSKNGAQTLLDTELSSIADGIIFNPYEVCAPLSVYMHTYL